MEPIKTLETGRGGGHRKNAGKLRYSLAPRFAQQEYVRVWTKGAEKYTEKDEQGNVIRDGAHNWRRGMTWCSVMDSLKRHVDRWEAGEDIDPENGCYHTSEIMANAAMLTEFVKIFGEGDDRQHSYLNHKRIGLDIDEVLAAFVPAYMEKFGITSTPEFWNFDKHIMNRLTKDLSPDWWLSLKPLIDPSELTFEPTCYITSRTVDTSVTEKWIADNHFPVVPVFTVKTPEEKLEIAREMRLDLFVDDRFETFTQFNKAGICCYLMDSAHNRRYNVGHKRIKSLSELTRY